ncbi:MAG: nucleotidyltransferase domain-containing protein [Caulobacteraceae bacterium]|nr:nucleotidyltransferase domain-containing protein [Caulobacter sp.]
MTAPRPPASLEEVLAVLRARRDEVRERLKVDFRGVAGSLARGQARPDSDVDVVADLLEGASLFTVARAELELEAEVRRPVQILGRRAMGPRFRSEIERDLQPL